MKKPKRILSFITAAAMAFAGIGALPDTGILPGLSVTASAEVLSGTYWKTEWNEAAKTVTGSSAAIPSETRVFNGTLEYYEEIGTDDLIEEELWYYVDKDTTVNERLNVRRHKTVNFIIKNGVTLTCNKGIEVARRDGDNDQDYYGGTLNIYGESATGGKLIARADDDNAAIGGRSGYFNGRINIYSGEVEATGGEDGAGIGSGKKADAGWYGEINIYGGKITATGGYSAAGIGGGYKSPSQYVRIYGGEVKATAGKYASGIGSGDGRGRFDIIINGGKVTAKGSHGGAGIGGGHGDAAMGTIIINGGTVDADGGMIDVTNPDDRSYYAGAGIGSGSSAGSLTTANFKGEITINGGKVTATGGGFHIYYTSGVLSGSEGAAGIGSGSGTNMQGTITVNGGNIEAYGRHGGAAIGAGKEVDFGYGGECEGTVNIYGGDLYLQASGDAVAIGHGEDGSDNGTLHIDGKLAVTKGNETTPVSYLDRGSEARSNSKVHIFPCGHDASGKTYTLNDNDTHNYFCTYCGHSDTEAHNLNYTFNDYYTHNYYCSDCGYSASEAHNMVNDACADCGYLNEPDPYASITNTTKVVKFDNKDWYLIEDNSKAANAGTVTLLTKDCVAASAYNSSGYYVEYDSSTIKTVVDAYYADSISEAAKTAVNGNKMFLLTKEQANEISLNVRKCNQASGATYDYWWLCSWGSNTKAAIEHCWDDKVEEYEYAPVNYVLGVCPALKLELSSVLFSSVNLSGGENAAVSGGSTVQNYFDLGTSRSAMTNVIYTANKGYTFPETSALYKTTNGITVTRTSDTVVTVSGTPTGVANVTIPDASAHTITISTDITNGTVEADRDTAVEGEIVTLTVTPGTGYAVGSISVNDGAVTLTDNGDGTYTFTMPDADVTVSAVFEQLSKPAAKVITAPAAIKGLTYTGKAQALITAGEADTSMEYSLDGTDYSDTVPTGTNANIYTVYYRAAADATHNAGYAVQLTVSVSRKALKVTGATAARRVFNGYPIVNVTSVTLSGICGTDDVAVDTSNLTGELASADAGVYTSLTLPAGLALKGASEDNYTLIQPTAPVTADVTIDKAEPTINVTTAAYNKTYGDAPFVIVGVTPSTSVATIGYEVTDGTDVISLTDTTVTILKTGTATITAYIPETINYTAASAVITVEVAKADSPKTKPQTEISVLESCTTVSDVGLPSGWEWADEDKGKTLAESGPVTAAAKYTGADADCYNNTTVSVTITKTSHTHTAGAEVHENVTASTCTTGGSYDKIIRCTECNEIISRTHCTTAPLGHTLGDPVYENEVKATCTGAGSGETAYYCAVCGTIMVRTSAMQPALGHNYISVVTTPATCSTAGVKTYTCSRCSDTYTEMIPKLDHKTTVISDNVTAATCTSSGSYDEINYCTRCEAEISRTRITVPALGHNFENSKCTRCGAIEVKLGTLADLLENATGDKLILALVADESVTKLKFPKNVKEITIDGGGHTLDFTGAANIKPNQELTLANITINAEKNGKKQNITLTAATDGLVVENVTFDGKKTTITATKGDLTLDNVTAADLTVKGAAKTTLTIISDVSAATVSGFGNIKAEGSLTVAKTLKVNTLDLSGNAVLNVVKDAAITLSKGISGNGTINLASGFKAITINGKATGNIKLTGDTMTDGQLIFKSKLTNLNDVFDVSGIAPEVTDGEYSYGLYSKSGKVYLRAFRMQFGDTTYCELSDVLNGINKSKENGKSYELDLLGDIDFGSSFKLPSKGKYSSLTIDGNGHSISFKGTTLTLTGDLTLKNVKITAMKNGKPVAWKIKKMQYELVTDNAELDNCTTE